MKTTEYRVRPVVRYVVTKFESDPEAGSVGSGVLGEFDNEANADEVCRVMGLEAHWASRRGDGPAVTGQQTEG